MDEIIDLAISACDNSQMPMCYDWKHRFTHEHVVMLPEFWKALGKACNQTMLDPLLQDSLWAKNAMDFYRVSLNYGFETAVTCLQSATKDFIK
jgi:hypothetical protein